MKGYAGSILLVDLSSGLLTRATPPADLYRQFLGGRGLAAKLLWDSGAASLPPGHEQSPLIFATGPITGTNAPSSGRTTLAFRSPATGLYFKSSGAAHWGATLKYAGYDALVITGKATAPVYLWIDDDKAEIRPAGHLWGMEIPELVDWVEESEEHRGAEVALCGPAGEKGVAFAGVAFSCHSFAARGGGGALMGGKNLKAIIVRGSGEIEVSHPPELVAKSLAYTTELGTAEVRQRLRMYGTASLVPIRNEMHMLPAKNYQTVYTEDANKISGQYLREKGYLVARAGCFQCGTACHRFTRVPSGPYAGVASAGPEYESVASLGLGCLVTETDVLLKANERCNSLGLDTISTGGVVQWAMEAYERGLITKEDTGGIELTWGNGEALVAMVEKIAAREGIGDLLAQGTRRASEMLGGDSWQWASQVKGLETSRAELRARKGYALALAVNPRGPDHLTSQVYAEDGASAQARALIRRICGDEKYASSRQVEKRADIVKWHESCYALTDCLGFCTFATLGHGYVLNLEPMTEFFALVTGENREAEDLLTVGERVFNLEKCFNVVCRAGRADDHIPWRFLHDPIPTGPNVGQLTTEAEMNYMLDEYYKLHGWEEATGFPRRETLVRLGLADAADRLAAEGRLGKD